MNGTGVRGISACELEALSTIAAIPHYGPASLTRRLVDQLRQEYPRLPVVTIDNAGDLELPGTAAEIIRPRGNIGFAAAINRAADLALERSARRLWILNNDALPAPGCLDHLIAALDDNPGCALVTALLIDGESSPPVVEAVGSGLNLETGRHRQTGNGEPLEHFAGGLINVQAIPLTCALLRMQAVSDLAARETWPAEVTRLLDEPLFNYFEDMDLCLRLGRLGWTTGCAPAARAVHGVGGSQGGRWSRRRMYYSVRNHLEIIRRHGVPLPPPLRQAREIAIILGYLAMLSSCPPQQRGPVIRGVLEGAKAWYAGETGPAEP
ncbi:MAG: hypothetical protein GMKNLPBB_02482 [Myxococcota bacterium]|nr:hypothetical protein [Myxococcota bacterium]